MSSAYITCLLSVFYGQSATNGTFKIIGDQIRKDPKLLVTSTAAIIENILYHDGVFPSVVSLIYFQLRL